MSDSNHPYWFYFNLALLALLAMVVIVITKNQPPTKSVVELADNYWQQKTGYVAGLNKPLAELSGLVEVGVEVAKVDQLNSIKQQLLSLRVPSGYQDFHLEVVLKISQLEELLSDSTSAAPSNQLAVAKLQAELQALIAEYNNFNN